MKVKRTLALILVLCLSLGVLSGCGGSTDTPESTAPEEEAESNLDLGEIPELTFPKEITLIVPFAAGGAFDVMARNVQAIANQMYGVNIIVNCVSGGGSAVGVTQVLTSNPDGYTIGFGSTSYLGLIAQGQMDAEVDDADFLC